MNKVILMGRLTRDPEVRYTQGENSLCIANFSIAVDRRFNRNNQDGQTADFINIVAFGKLAEHVEKYYRKGLKTALTGRIQTRNYTNREGQKVYVTEVVAEELEFAESKNAAGNGGGSGSYGGGNYGGSGNGGNYGGSGSYGNGGGNYGGGYSAPAQNQSAPASDALDGFMNIPDGIDEELPFN
ncbi:MAG: single-stranded DNA-binding protein [Sarcina sp.]|nr:single-stranded DNA-binding protein [Sarcina sp.]